MQIIKTIDVPGIGDHRVWAGQPKGGKHAGTDRASITMSLRDFADSPELLELLGAQRVSITFDPSVARLIARDVPETAAAWAAKGIKPAAKSAKRAA